ncbi:MaoC/PaaZ C-terminal domain-containing protein [Actinomyces faecalis]|uniref:MaoC/PaaZ C-terminal domain-containing protein n=1 Tax=Actinomyces faecalis TaxID=2722820 RepID=UPI0015553D12|nr:MaoC/PaaZ C-terminal domain-containing protein [Actinomyces faecalis]
MSATDPVDLPSAGSRHAWEMVAVDGATQVDAPALVHVLTAVLRRSSTWACEPEGNLERRAVGAVAGLGPALLVLARLRSSGLLVWDGLVHRRLRVVPADSGSSSDEGVLRLATTRRAGWEMTEVGSLAGGWQVTTWLAWPQAGRRAGPAGPGAGASALTGEPGEASFSSGTSEDPEILVLPQDVQAWARASGDDNRLHLVPGAARHQGLSSDDGVIVHGMLLAALSMVLEPASGAVDLRFVAPVPLTDRAGLWARGGSLYDVRGLVLRRRS